MARDGSGTMSVPNDDFLSGTVISSSEMDANFAAIVLALTQSIAVDGQSVVTGDIPLATHKLTGVSVGSASTDSANLGQIQAEAFIWCGTAGGSADAITLTPAPAITAYVAGQRFVWMASGSVNTGATTVAISGLSTIALQENGAALIAGNHTASKMFMGILNTTSTMQIMQFQSAGTATSVGTLTALQVDNININGNTVSSTAGTDLNITPLSGQQIVLDGTIVVDAGVVTGATSITSTAFVGALTGNADTATNQSGTNTGDEVAASLTAAGVIEIATTAEVNTGSDDTRAVSPAGLTAWTGDTALVTVGTIGTGTWQGTAINATYLDGQSGTNTGDEVTASATAAGVAELATIAEAKAGTADRVAALPVLSELIQDGTLTYIAAGGAADVQTLTLVPAITAYSGGQAFRFVPVANNTTTTPTLNVNAVGAKTIQKSNGAGALGALVAGDLDANIDAVVSYNAAGDVFVLENPAVLCLMTLG
jgi:hypothetical protein